MSLEAPPSKRAKLDDNAATLAFGQQGNCSKQEVRGLGMCVCGSNTVGEEEWGKDGLVKNLRNLITRNHAPLNFSLEPRPLRYLSFPGQLSLFETSALAGLE